MPIAQCPDCRKDISDTSPACIHCGRPFAFNAPAPALAKKASMGLQCPKCGSEDTRKVSLVHAEGSSTSRIAGTGVTAGGDIGFASGVSRGQTALAEQLKPPHKSDIVFPLIGGLGGAIAGGVLIGMTNHSIDGREAAILAGTIIGAVVGLLIGAVVDRTIHRDENARALADWQRKFICRRCATVFIPK